MPEEEKKAPSSRQVMKAFLFARANDFVRSRPELSRLPRAERRIHAREIANRITSQALEEMKTHVGR